MSCHLRVGAMNCVAFTRQVTRAHNQIQHVLVQDLLLFIFCFSHASAVALQMAKSVCQSITLDHKYFKNYCLDCIDVLYKHVWL